MLDILNKINQPEDLRNIEINDLEKLSEEIREVLLQKLSKNGGHFGPNFGMVEAIIAMHSVFESPQDKFVLDVSHQCYAHKILTGRKEGFIEENSYRTVSGYTNPDSIKKELHQESQNTVVLHQCLYTHHFHQIFCQHYEPIPLQPLQECPVFPRFRYA